MKNWLTAEKDGPAQRMPPCSQPGFPSGFCTCRRCQAASRQAQKTSFGPGEGCDPLVMELYRRMVVPVG